MSRSTRVGTRACIRAGLRRTRSPECRLVSVLAQKGYYANDPRKTRRGNSAIGARHGTGDGGKEAGRRKRTTEDVEADLASSRSLSDRNASVYTSTIPVVRPTD